jgi:3-hydroxyacyl-[acyl-carrier-protein] dehydratase
VRFELVDQVIEQTDQRIVTLKAVTSAEEYLADHFPTFAVLPGVMMLESLIQAARRLLADHPEAGPGPWTLAEARNVRYAAMVRPGQQLRVTVELAKADPPRFAFKAQGQVDQAAAVNARFTLRTAEPLQPQSQAAPEI